MCGIAGIHRYRDDGAPVSQHELARICDAMAVRGPDGRGIYVDERSSIGLAHLRLAIIDLSDAGAQPMWNADRSLALTFNGEIYNYRALRRELQAKGWKFASESDSEVILALYADQGSRMLDRLRGMFAFAIWDARNRTLFAARDAFGIKPLYYADDGSTLRFASQVKALVVGGAVDASPEPAGSVGFLLWGAVPEPFTLHRGVRALPAGSFLKVEPGKAPVVRQWFSVRDELVAAQDEARPFVPFDRGELAAQLTEAVQHHLVADVPVALFLSAGIDSTAIASLATSGREASITSFTLGFDEYRNTPDDEVPMAERTAALLGTTQVTRRIARDDFAHETDAILAAMDQPSIDGVNTYLVCREAKRAGIKVALSGLGGDELFGGYPSFRDVPRLTRSLSWLAGAPGAGAAARLVRGAMASLLPATASPKLAGVAEYGGTIEGAYLLRRALHMPYELEALLSPGTVRAGLEALQSLPMLARLHEGIRSPHAKVAALELAWYMRNQLLRDADWAGMAHSVEVRVPFVDVPLFRALSPWLVSGAPPTKTDLVQAACPLFAETLLGRQKTGFTVPVRQWLSDSAARPAAEPAETPADRGLRGWARRALPPQAPQFRALVLVSDAYGGIGGIAKFNTDLIGAIAAMPQCAEVVVLPRGIASKVYELPPRVRFVTDAAGSKLRFARAALAAAGDGRYDVVICGHINLVPVAAAAAARAGAPAMLTIHGVDAWQPHPSPIVRALAPRMDRIVGVSHFTLERFAAWSGVARERLALLPNCVDLTRFTPGPRPVDLKQALGIEGRMVIMTLGRIAADERVKGFDEVIDAMPALLKVMPDVAYVVCGDGTDRARLADKVRALGLSGRVVFAGFVPESEKLRYYRMADAFVMPSRGEGFGIVLLEALACGVPVIGSAVDGSREALQDGALGRLVDPADPNELVGAIVDVLTAERTRRAPRGAPDLARYSPEAFARRAAGIVGDVVTPATTLSGAVPAT